MLLQARSRRLRARRWASTRSPRCRATRLSRRSSRARAGTRRTSANGCGASRASLWSAPTARRARSPMTSSRWHAHGNVYLVAEETELTPERVRADARGTDGIVQVVRAGERDVEIVIWNTDGSTAEMSG